MRPHSDAGAPAVTAGVAARLHRLDPNLRPVWSAHSRDPLTWDRILTRGHVNPDVESPQAWIPAGAVADPGWYLYRRDDTSDNHHFVQFAGHRFDDLSVLRLERDIARFVDAKHIHRLISERNTRKREAEYDSYRENRSEVLEENERRIEDLVAGGRHGRRDGKIFSGGGVSRRGSTGTVLTDSAADGWYLPK